MSRIPPLDWKRLKCVFEHDGFQFSKRSGKGTSHWIGTKAGVSRPIVIPEYPEIAQDIIHANMRTVGMSREHFLELLKQC